MFKIKLGDVLDIEKELESHEKSFASVGQSSRDSKSRHKIPGRSPSTSSTSINLSSEPPDSKSSHQIPGSSPSTSAAITKPSTEPPGGKSKHQIPGRSPSTSSTSINLSSERLGVLYSKSDDDSSLYSHSTASNHEADDLDHSETLQEHSELSTNPNNIIPASISPSLSNNSKLINDDNSSSIPTGPAPGDTDGENIDLTEYLPLETINELSDYERNSILGKIKLYLHCQSQGLNFKLVLPGVPLKSTSRSTKSNLKASTSQALKDVTNSSLRRSSRNRDPVSHQELSSSDSDHSPRKKKKSRYSDSSSSRQARKENSERQTTDDDSSRVIVIPDYLSNFLEAPNLNEDEKSLIKDFIGDVSIPNYDVRNILKDKRGVERALNQLTTKGPVFGTDLNIVIDELVTHLFSQVRKGLNIPAEMKVGMAVSFVAAFPKMCQALVSPDDKPWTWLFSREENCGKLANNVTSKQRQASHPKPRGGGLERRKNPAKPAEVERQAVTVQELNLSNDVRYLRVLLDNDRTRDTIETLAKKTFEERRAIIKKQTVPLKVLLEAFPFITFLKGAMIDFEFDLIYPGKGEGFLKNFHLYVPKLLKVGELDEKKYPPRVFNTFSDDDLNACLILSEYLPKPKKTKSYESTMNPSPDISDFFHVIPVGSNIQHEIARRSIERSHPVQPYLLCLGHPRCLGKITLVWGDKESTDFPIGTAPLKAIDYLSKAFHVMQVPYPLGWKNFFRFTSYHFYHVEPDHKRLSVFTAQFVELNAIEISQI